jgi:hypothetical protein
VASGCTNPPYSSPGKELDAVNNDFTDCYTQASLKANTPPYPDSPLRVVDKETDACMQARGYKGHLWWF